MTPIDIKNIANTGVDGFIDCDILFYGKNEYYRYTASSHDAEPSCRLIYEEIVSGKWGDITPFTPYEMSINELKSQRLSELAALRYQHETAGITLSGMSIATDRQSQALITGAWSISQINPTILIDWKGVNGWIQIDAATITAIAGAVAAHVQACFSNERVLSTAIAAATTIEALNAVDLTVGWSA